MCSETRPNAKPENVSNKAKKTCNYKSSVQTWRNLFCFFLPTQKKGKRNPTHIAAHFQAPTSQRPNQRLAKELQFCLRTRAKLLLLSFKQTEIIEISKMKKEIDNKLNLKNIKPTAMRQLVLQVLTEQKTAISLPELEQKFEKADKATLYRTLKTFQENKLIHSIEDGSGSLRYALCQDNCECDPEDLHVHFLCTNCNQTFCLNDIPVPTINLPSSFSLESVNMVVKGVCSNCKK